LNTIAPTVPTSRRSGSTLLIAGAVALAVGGASAGWLMRGNAEPPAPVAAATTAFEPLETQVASTQAAPAVDAPVPSAKRAAPDKPAPVARTAPAKQPRTSPQAYAGERATPLPTQRAAVCADCGIVESVVPVTRKGEGSGVGAVAGGVLGAVVGNQVGGGNGRKAMTVLGAIGGGLAGHEIEKRTKAETVYEVKVRMEDGSVRTITQSTQPAAGSRVIVEGDTIRPASTSESAPRAIRTST
jgi:outer membrane lipoprotein SlyB